MSSQIRFHYSDEVEEAINKQINTELRNSYIYLSMAYHFDRDDTAYCKLSKWLKEQSDDEREHALGLMKYQNTRGGRIKLMDIAKPGKDDWGTPLEVFEAALEAEKTNHQAILDLHAIAQRNQDVLTTTFLEENYLKQGLEEIEKVAKFTTNLRRAGPAFGLYGECMMEQLTKMCVDSKAKP